jgi:hypothetical protein
MHTQSDNLVQLPEALRGQFNALEKRLWRVDTIIAVAGALCGLLVSYALLFISDRLWDTPVWMRLLFTGIGIAILVYFTYGWLKLWVWNRRDTRAMANIVQKQHRRLGDRLLGIVELADATKRPPNFSDALCRAAISQVSTEALKVDFRMAVATRKPRIYSLVAVVLVLLVLTPCVLVPDASANALVRWLWPVSSTPRFTFVSINELPNPFIVPHGEPFKIEFGITLHSAVKPTEASCQYDKQPVIVAPVKNNQVSLSVPPQTQAGNMRLRVGDVSRTIRVEPTYRPSLKLLTAQIQMPDYLHHPDASQEVKNARLTTVEGSRVTLKGKVTRTLLQAAMGLETSQPLPVQKDEFTTPVLNVLSDMKLSFTWLDTLHLDTKTPTLVSIVAQKDNVPQVEFPELGRAVAILEDEVLPVRITSQDDFGVKDIGVRVEYSTPQKPEEIIVITNQVKMGGYLEKHLDGKYDFSPMLLRLAPGTAVGLRATATDYFPGRIPSESMMHRIFVMSKEEHARLIQEDFERLRAAIEELTRKQENLTGDTKLVKDMKPTDLAKEETAKQLGEQAADQQEYAKQMEKLAQETLKTTREALRNKAIPTDVVKDWTENTEIMQNIARQQMAKASQSLQNAQKNPAQRKEQAEQAQQKEQEALNEMQELQKKMASTLDKMQAKSLADRLRAVGQTEKETGESLQKSLAETIGLNKDELPAEARKNLNRMAADQEKTSKQSRKLQDEIQRFFQRTGMEQHGEVSKDMEEQKVADQIAQLSDLIKDNISSQAMVQSKDLSDKFGKWADKLDKKDKEDGGGQGGSGAGGGEKKMSEEELEKMLALLRLREQQETLREQTRLINQFHKGKEEYSQDTQKLAGKQDGMSRDLRKLKRDRMFEKAKERMEQAGEAMEDANSDLQRPRTDEKTQSAQSDAMNLLDEAIQNMMPSQGKGQKQQQQQQGMMAFMQMMAMGQGKPEMGEQQQQEGKQNAGNTQSNTGNTDKSNNQMSGDVQGAAGANRKVEKAGGGTSRAMPAEYREALQGYFNAIEKVN